MNNAKEENIKVRENKPARNQILCGQVVLEWQCKLDFLDRGPSTERRESNQKYKEKL
jgi:hypothetical protein